MPVHSNDFYKLSQSSLTKTLLPASFRWVRPFACLCTFLHLRLVRSFPAGVFLDYMGPRITVCLGSLLLAGGLLSVAFAQELSSTLYYVGFFLMSAGGSCIANSTFNFGELFPDQSAGIIGALSTGEETSPARIPSLSMLLRERSRVIVLCGFADADLAPSASNHVALRISGFDAIPDSP